MHVLTLFSQAMPHLRMWTCTMLQATAGPDILKGLVKLGDIWLLRRYHPAWCFLQVAGYQVGLNPCFHVGFKARFLAVARMLISHCWVFRHFLHLQTCFTDSYTSGNTYSSYIDLYNATRNTWTRYPRGLGQARSNLAAASLSSGLVFFAGGETIGTCIYVSNQCTFIMLSST